MTEKIKKAFSFRFYLKKLFELEAKPEETARGLALGVFIGFLPVNGFQVLIAVTIAALTRVSKIAAAIGTHVTNPWTTIPVLVLDYYVGSLVLGRKPSLEGDFTSLSGLLSVGKEILVPTFVGGLILGTIFSVISYFGLKKLLESKVSRVKEAVRQKKQGIRA